MPEPVGDPVALPDDADETSPLRSTGAAARSDLPPPIAMPAPTLVRPGALGRLISLVISVGLAWALVVAITAWLLGLLLARG